MARSGLGKYQLFLRRALKKAGKPKPADELRKRTLNLIASHPDLREYYNSQTGKPPNSAAPSFGWSAAVFIELALMKNAQIKSQGTNII